jgi:hypothetical protein
MQPNFLNLQRIPRVPVKRCRNVGLHLISQNLHIILEEPEKPDALPILTNAPKPNKKHKLETTIFAISKKVSF